jgi:DNA-directed RNA polymerase specialized sigma24 family protein
MNYTDQQLITMIREGGLAAQKAIDFLYHTYFNHSRAIVFKTFGSDAPFVTKELHGETIMALVKRLVAEDFDIQQSIKQYFIGILKYKKIDLLTKRIEERQKNQAIAANTNTNDNENEYWTNQMSIQNSQDYDTKKALFLNCFYRAFESLRNDNHKFILCKRLYQGLDYADIARPDRDEVTLRQDYHRGILGLLNALKAELGVDYDENQLKSIKNLLLQKEATNFIDNLKNICSQYQNLNIHD